jgi:hypothetical protein
MPLYGAPQDDLLPTSRAEVPIKGRSTTSFIVDKLSERASLVFDLDFCFLNNEITGSKTSRDFSTVGTMTDMTPSLSEKAAVMDCHLH